METLFGLDVVVDDDLHARAVAEGQGLEDEGDLFCWLAEQARESGCWPHCGCERRGLCCLDHRVVRSSTGELDLQEIDHRTGQPRPPEAAPPRTGGEGLGIPAHLGADLALGAHVHRHAAPILPGRRGFLLRWKRFSLRTLPAYRPRDPVPSS